MKKLRFLNWREWPCCARKWAVRGAVAGALLTACGYALNHWANSLGLQGADHSVLIVGIPSIVPLFPLAMIFIAFGLHFPPRWSEDAFDGGHVWRIYLLAGLLNVILLAALGAAIGFIFNLLVKRREQKNPVN